MSSAATILPCAMCSANIGPPLGSSLWQAWIGRSRRYWICMLRCQGGWGRGLPELEMPLGVAMQGAACLAELVQSKPRNIWVVAGELITTKASKFSPLPITWSACKHAPGRQGWPRWGKGRALILIDITGMQCAGYARFGSGSSHVPGLKIHLATSARAAASRHSHKSPHL